MDIKKYHRQAKAEYLCNVYEFISVGEGRELNQLENMHVRIKYPEVLDWYDSLDNGGKQRVYRFLAENYGT